MWEWLEARYALQALWAAWGALAIGYGGFILLERLVPARRNPNLQEMGAEVRANVVFILLNPVAVFFGALLSAPAASLLGGPLLHLPLSTFGSEPISAFALAFVPFFIFDFFYYWFHRFQHEWKWLWEVHRLHHSERVLNVTTNFRHHWLEEFFRAFFILLPMNWLVTIEPTSSVLAAILIGQWSNFFHANIRLSLGPLTPVFTGPQYHRIHHSIESKHLSKNYAAFLPLWDWMFGTYWRPRHGEWPGAGLTDTDGMWSLPEFLFSPFIGWWRTFRRESCTDR